MAKEKLKCDTCYFHLTSGDSKLGETCPWCRRGKMIKDG